MPQLFIKNMVCDRCKTSVQHALEKINLPYRQIELGEVELLGLPTEQHLEVLRSQLSSLGFELIEDKNSRIISMIKTTVIGLVRNPEKNKKLKLSAHLSDVLLKDYGTLSSLFSNVEGLTIEQFYILQKIEFVKELLVYDELSLTQIADKLHYSSVQHLSNQFKKITGLTPSHFKTIGRVKRRPLDKI